MKAPRQLALIAGLLAASLIGLGQTTRAPNDHPEFLSASSKHFVTFRPFYSATLPNDELMVQLQQPIEFRKILNLLASAKDKEAELINGKSIKSFLLLNEFGPPWSEVCRDMQQRFLEHKKAAQSVRSLVDFVEMNQQVLTNFCNVISEPRSN